MMTAVRAMSGVVSARFSNVVFPLPRKPVRMVTGVRAGAGSMGVAIK
jgi:hypothetical protein